MVGTVLSAAGLLERRQGEPCRPVVGLGLEGDPQSTSPPSRNKVRTHNPAAAPATVRSQSRSCCLVTLTCLGGAGTVTGSKHLLEAQGLADSGALPQPRKWQLAITLNF